MREILYHRPADGKSTPLKIVAVDDKGMGGANHRYDILGFSAIANPAGVGLEVPSNRMHILFQNGGVIDHGVNGITHEALLAIVADRLESFQNGQFPCDENEAALQHVQMALQALHSRTSRRVSQGTEGKLEERTNHGDAKFTDTVHADSDQPNPQGGIRRTAIPTGFTLVGRMKKLDEAVKIATSPGNYDSDPYMLGMANGMLLAQAVLNDKSPDYLTAPSKWTSDKAGQKEPGSSQPVNVEGIERQKPVEDAENKNREPIKPLVGGTREQRPVEDEDIKDKVARENDEALNKAEDDKD